MVVYFILLLLILGLAYPLCIKNPSKVKTICYLVITFLYMWFLATFRKGIGYDYNVYIKIFDRIQQLPWSQLFTTEFEPGFVILTKLIGMISSSSVVMYGVYSALILIPVVIFIYRFSTDPWISTWLYVTMAFLFMNMNFIRQSLACAVTTFAYGFLMKKKPIPYMLIVLVAASFHKTALIMIPIYFLVHIKLNKAKIIAYCLTVLTLFLFSEYVVDFVTDYIFEGYKGKRFVVKILGPNFLILPLMALILGLSVYHIWKNRDKNASVYLNLLILNMTFWLFGSLKHMVLERFCEYTYLYSIVLIPMALRMLLASPEAYAQRAQLEQETKTQKTVKLQQKNQLEKLNSMVADGKQYYISATVAVFFITFMYLYYGMYVNNFHDVIQYQTVIPWLNDLLPVPNPSFYN